MGEIIPVILCGGAGKRLMPLSSADMPKQFLKLIDPDKTLLQKTFERALSLTGANPSSVIVVTCQGHAEIAREQLADFAPRVLAEPMSRNTAPAIALAAQSAKAEDILFVMPCDAHIKDDTNLHPALDIAKGHAEHGQIAIFGIKPTRPETGYGYIKFGERRNGAYAVEHFAEKPDHGTAFRYLQSEKYLWNSGMSVFKAKTILDEFRLLAPNILAYLDDYKRLPNVAFDVAILEKSDKLAVIPCSMDWIDIGTWNGLFEALGGNAVTLLTRHSSEKAENPDFSRNNEKLNK